MGRSQVLRHMANSLWTPDHYTHILGFHHKVKNTQLYRLFLYAVALLFPLTGTMWPKPVSSMTMVRSMKTWFERTQGACTEPWPESTLKTFGINYNADWTSGLLTQHHCWPRKAPVSPILTIMLQNLFRIWNGMLKKHPHTHKTTY